MSSARLRSRPDLLAEPAVSPRRANLLRLALVTFTAALLAVTWKLWTPQTEFPRVPLIRGSSLLSAEWLEAGLLVAALVIAALTTIIGCRPRAGRISLLIMAACLALLIVQDQQRLQPWAYQMSLSSLVLALCPTPCAFRLLRWLTISIYFYSGLAKLDFTFLHTLGQQFVNLPLGWFGASLDNCPEVVRLGAAAILPLGELAIAVGFCFRITRKIALFGSVVCHLMLLVLLSSWGLGHSWGVLLWNAYFVVQNVLLFGGLPQKETGQAQNINADAVSQIACQPASPSLESSHWVWVTALIALAMLLPILEPFGYFDAWPSWALYAPSNQRATVWVHRRAADRLVGLRDFLIEDDPTDHWLRLRMDRWSLATLGAPVYPQNRFQLGVAVGLIQRFDLGPWLQVTLASQADRFDGTRQQQSLVGIAAIEAAQATFWLNSRPAGNFSPGWAGSREGGAKRSGL